MNDSLLIGWLQDRVFWPVDKFGPDELELINSENDWLCIAKLLLQLSIKNLFVL